MQRLGRGSGRKAGGLTGALHSLMCLIGLVMVWVGFVEHVLCLIAWFAGHSSSYENGVEHKNRIFYIPSLVHFFPMQVRTFIATRYKMSEGHASNITSRTTQIEGHITFLDFSPYAMQITQLHSNTNSHIMRNRTRPIDRLKSIRPLIS